MTKFSSFFSPNKILNAYFYQLPKKYVKISTKIAKMFVC